MGIQPKAYLTPGWAPQHPLSSEPNNLWQVPARIPGWSLPRMYVIGEIMVSEVILRRSCFLTRHPSAPLMLALFQCAPSRSPALLGLRAGCRRRPSWAVFLTDPSTMNSGPKRHSQDLGCVPAAWFLRASLALDSGLSHITGRGQGKRLCTEHAGKLSQNQEDSLLLPISDTRQLTAQFWARSTPGTGELPWPGPG